MQLRPPTNWRTNGNFIAIITRTASRRIRIDHKFTARHRHTHNRGRGQGRIEKVRKYDTYEPRGDSQIFMHFPNGRNQNSRCQLLSNDIRPFSSKRFDQSRLETQLARDKDAPRPLIYGAGLLPEPTSEDHLQKNTPPENRARCSAK